MKRDSLAQELINHTTAFWHQPSSTLSPQKSIKKTAKKLKIGDLIATKVPCSKNVNSSTVIQGIVVNLSGRSVVMEITSIPHETMFYLGQLHTVAINQCWRIRTDSAI
jgi:hypothetical protein